MGNLSMWTARYRPVGDKLCNGFMLTLANSEERARQCFQKEIEKMEAELVKYHAQYELLRLHELPDVVVEFRPSAVDGMGLL